MMDQVTVGSFRFGHRIRICFDLCLSLDHLVLVRPNFESPPSADRCLDYFCVAACLSSDHCLGLAGQSLDDYWGLGNLSLGRHSVVGGLGLSEFYRLNLELADLLPVDFLKLAYYRFDSGLAEDRLNFQSLGCLASTEKYH